MNARFSWLHWLLASALLAAGAAFVAGEVAGYRARTTVAEATSTDARLRAALFDSEVARFRLMPLALQDDSDVAATLADRPGALDKLNRKLEALAHDTGASVIYLIDRNGIAIAASNWRRPDSFVGGDYRFRNYFQAARRDGSAMQFARGTRSGRPGLFLSRRAPGGGVIVVKLEFDAIEAAWRAAGGVTYVRDPIGVVLVTSRADWRFTTTRALSPTQMTALKAERSLPDDALAALPPPPRDDVQETVPTARSGWTLTLRRSAAPPVHAARRAAMIGAVLTVVALTALAWALWQRIRYTRRRTAELEAAVTARTAALTREMEERAASEASAAELREGLRQANRLATLGQVTASVAHETAQPVTAIRTYADTSTRLLDRGDTDAVRENLSAIARLSDRIGAITAELRGFSRRRTGEVRPLPLAELIDGALLILKEQLRAVSLERPWIGPEVVVMGGRVRLEQVLVNILQNAIEALAGRPDARIALSIATTADRVVLTISDNGPGIAADVSPRLFTPFVTSRPSGLGLGLVIAHDIMVEFGGSLRLCPSDSGACFEIGMVRA